MSHEIAKPPLSGPFFKPSIAERNKSKAGKSDRKRAARPGNSEDHLALIRQLPCCVTGRHGPNDPHHLKQTGTRERGGARRSPDRWAVPLCREKHDELERLGSRREPQWFREHGVEDPLGLANALWNATGDIGRMALIVLAHRYGGSP